MQHARARDRDASAGRPDWAALAARHPGAGAARSASRRSASPTPTSRPRKRGCSHWLAAGRHGAMDYMARHGATRARPAELVPGTLRVITARMNYLPPAARASERRARRSARRRSSRATRSAATTTRCCAAGCSSSPTRIARRGRRLRLSRVHRQRAGAGGGARGEGRPRLARQAHAAADARRGLVVLPGRDLHRPAAAVDAAAAGALRQLHARASTSARPARSSRPTSSTRAAASRT